VRSDTHNYYTYNYYYNGDTVAADTSWSTDSIAPVDHTTFEDIREKLEQQAEEPYEVTLADRYFEDAIGAFELDNYDRAAEMFATAIKFAPDDIILPFAYCQSLFAAEEYTQAAEVLRAALAKVSPEEEGIFYPRGLYSDDDILFEQMSQLAEKAELYSFDGDLQLLMGYNLLGIGEIDEAVEPLRLATLDLENAPAAIVLLGLLEKMRIETAEETD
jgi:tetratricopeptide (TPR) repeat protein